MTLPTSYSDGGTVHGADLNAWDTAINALTNAAVPGYSTQAASATTLTLTSSSSAVQIITGSGGQTQLITLPTTSVAAGGTWLIVNNNNAAVTVQSSGANTVLVLAAGTAATFTAAVATPTTAANWTAQYGGISVVSGKALTVNNSITLSGTDGDTFNVDAIPVQNLTGAQNAASAGGPFGTTNTIVEQLTIPANSLTAGQTFRIESFGTNNATSGTLTYQIHLGTAGTTADATITTVAPNIAASGGSTCKSLLTIRTTGSSGTCIAEALGVGSTTVVSTTTATSTVNTTVQNVLSLSASVNHGSHTTQVTALSWAEA